MSDGERSCSNCGADVPVGARFCPNCGTVQAVRSDERRVVTVLFGDVVGFTALSEHRDPEQVKNLIDRCFERLASDVEAFGGHVDKIVGDGILALFGARQAHEDDPERAVRAALQMQRTLGAWAEEFEAGLRMRIGVNTGEVLVGTLRAGGDVTAMGDVVNVANRLQASADPGQVLVGRTTFAATREVMRYRELGPLRARGREEPVEAWLADEPLGRPGFRPHRARTPLVGRKAELGMLWHALGTSVDHRRPHLILLSGEAGVGKSRLAEEITDIARNEHGALVVEGRCMPYGEANVWWPVAEALRQACEIAPQDPADVAIDKCRTAVADLVGVADEGAEASRVADGLLYLMGYEATLHDVEPSRARDEAMRAVQVGLGALAAQRPLVVVISELHWADEMVLDLADRLFERLRDVPFILLATARPELQDRWTPKPGRHNLFVINLDPLDRDAATQLVRTFLGVEPPPEVLSVLLERSGGNPLFLEELVALLGETGALGDGERGLGDLPATLRGLVTARLDALAPAERSLVEDAAVIGRTGTVEAVSALAGTRGDRAPVALEQLVDRDVLEMHDGEFAFRSDLVRDVAYETLTKGERARRHAALASWLEGRGKQTEREAELLERIAHHYGLAAELVLDVGGVDGVPHDLHEKALHWLERAAARAEERETSAMSVHLFDQALRLARDDEVRRRALWLGRARARATQRDLDAARVDVSDAMASSESAGDRSGYASALVVMADIEEKEGRLHASAETLDEAVGIFRDLGDERGEADALRRWGMTQLHLDRHGEAEEAVRRALALFRELEDRRGEAWGLQNLAWIAFTDGQFDVAEERLLRAEEMFREVGDFGGMGWCIGLLGYVRYFRGDLDYAAGVAEAGIGITQEMGDKWAEGMMVALLAACRLWQGRTDVARELAERAKGLFVNIDDAFGQGQSGIALAWALALTGHATEAIEQAERAIAASQAAPGIYGTVVMGAACVLGTIGYTDRAQELLESELADWDWDDPGVKVSAANWGAGAGLVALQRGEPSEVLAMLRRAWAREIEDGVQANVGSVLSLVATAAGDPELGREAAGRTLTMAAGTYADRIRASLGDAFARLRLGDRAGAIDSLEAGRKLADGSEDRVHQGLVRLAEGHLLARLGRADADEALAEARRWLEELEVRTEGWDRAFALLSGD